MDGIVAVVFAFQGFLGVQAGGQPISAEPTPEIRACITANAPAVERAFESLSEGADFLTQKVCAVEIHQQSQAVWAEQTRKERARREARTKAMCEARPTQAPAASTDESTAAPAYMEMMCDSTMADFLEDGMEPFYAGLFVGAAPSPQTSALAATTLLALRVERKP